MERLFNSHHLISLGSVSNSGFLCNNLKVHKRVVHKNPRIINYDHIEFYYKDYHNFSLLLLITNFLWLLGQIEYNL